MWILILTIVIQRNEPAASVSAVPGFNTEATCMAAAKTWLEKQGELRTQYGAIRSQTAICAKA